MVTSLPDRSNPSGDFVPLAATLFQVFWVRVRIPCSQVSRTVISLSPDFSFQEIFIDVRIPSSKFAVTVLPLSLTVYWVSVRIPCLQVFCVSVRIPCSQVSRTVISLSPDFSFQEIFIDVRIPSSKFAVTVLPLSLTVYWVSVSIPSS